MDDIMHIRSKLVNRFLGGYLKNYIQEKLKLDVDTFHVESMELINQDDVIVVDAKVKATVPIAEAEKVAVKMGF